MKCPYCGQPLVKGYLSPAKATFLRWLPCDHGELFIPPEKFRKMGGVILGRVNKFLSISTEDQIAHMCKECNIIICYLDSQSDKK